MTIILYSIMMFMVLWLIYDILRRPKRVVKDEIVTATFQEGRWIFKLEEKEPENYGKTATALKHL